MSYTRFGEFVRHLRVAHHEVMGDMAKLLKTSTPYLSAVENGKKNVPPSWLPIIIEHYSLTGDQISELNSAVEESQTQLKLRLCGSDTIKRRTALQFARSFDGMDDETAEKIMRLLGGD